MKATATEEAKPLDHDALDASAEAAISRDGLIIAFCAAGLRLAAAEKELAEAKLVHAQLAYDVNCRRGDA